MKIVELTDFITAERTTRGIHVKSIEDAESNMELLKEEEVKLLKLRELIATATEQTQDQVKVHLSNLVTTGLQTVFPEKDYKFHVDFVTRRNQMECDLLIENHKGVKSRPKYRNGGGIMDVISLSLRIGRWSLSKSSEVMVLDEPSKFVSEDKQALVLSLMKTISEKLGIQWIIVTHIKELYEGADTVIEIQNGSIKKGDKDAEKTKTAKEKKKRKRKRTE